jgi:hypothetical protein
MISAAFATSLRRSTSALICWYRLSEIVSAIVVVLLAVADNDSTVLSIVVVSGGQWLQADQYLSRASTLVEHRRTSNRPLTG